ncbi:MAG TPA: cyclic-phosphate processing receiver domain-containing protein [Gemmataceae bacterium]|jgi:hypothetical protein
MKVWLDDIRPMPAGFDDPENGTRYQVAKWIEERAFWPQSESGGLRPLEWRVHSQNPVGHQNMVLALQNAGRFWKTSKE